MQPVNTNEANILQCAPQIIVFRVTWQIEKAVAGEIKIPTDNSNVERGGYDQIMLQQMQKIGS